MKKETRSSKDPLQTFSLGKDLDRATSEPVQTKEINKNEDADDADDAPGDDLDSDEQESSGFRNGLVLSASDKNRSTSRRRRWKLKHGKALRRNRASMRKKSFR